MWSIFPSPVSKHNGGDYICSIFTTKMNHLCPLKCVAHSCARRCVSSQEHGGEEITIVNPAQFPDKAVVSEYLEPVVLGTILAPDSYTGKIMSMCLVRETWCEGKTAPTMLFRLNSDRTLYFPYSVHILCCFFFSVGLDSVCVLLYRVEEPSKRTWCTLMTSVLWWSISSH